jgi:serine/threonine protein kinase
VRNGGKLDARPFFPLRLTSIYAYELITALAILHRLGIAHNDIKLDNIFVQTRHHLRLGDFGFACRYTPGLVYAHSGGTQGYASPEKMRGLEHDLERSDVWSLGCCLYALYTGDLPDVEAADVRVDAADDGAAMIESMLRHAPEQRPTFAELCATEFYARGRREFEAVFGYAVDPRAYTRDHRTGFEDDHPAPPLRLPSKPRAPEDAPPAESDDPMRSSPRGGLLGKLRALAGNLSPRGKK